MSEEQEVTGTLDKAVFLADVNAGIERVKVGMEAMVTEEEYSDAHSSQIFIACSECIRDLIVSGVYDTYVAPNV